MNTHHCCGKRKAVGSRVLRPSKRGHHLNENIMGHPKKLNTPKRKIERDKLFGNGKEQFAAGSTAAFRRVNLQVVWKLFIVLETTQGGFE